MKDEKVISTVHYEGKDAVAAPFWKDCFHEEDVTKQMLENEKNWYEYTVRFDGLTPTMITKSKCIKKAVNETKPKQRKKAKASSKNQKSK